MRELKIRAVRWVRLSGAKAPPGRALLAPPGLPEPAARFRPLRGNDPSHNAQPRVRQALCASAPSREAEAAESLPRVTRSRMAWGSAGSARSLSGIRCCPCLMRHRRLGIARVLSGGRTVPGTIDDERSRPGTVR